MITKVYENLFNVIEGVKDGTLDLDKAKVIADTSKVIIDAGKLEVSALKETQKYDVKILSKSKEGNVNGYLELQGGGN